MSGLPQLQHHATSKGTHSKAGSSASSTVTLPMALSVPPHSSAASPSPSLPSLRASSDSTSPATKDTSGSEGVTGIQHLPYSLPCSTPHPPLGSSEAQTLPPGATCDEAAAPRPRPCSLVQPLATRRTNPPTPPSTTPSGDGFAASPTSTATPLQATAGGTTPSAVVSPDLLARATPAFRALLLPHVGTPVQLDAAACEDAWSWLDQLGHEAQRAVQLCLANHLVGVVLRESDPKDAAEVRPSAPRQPPARTGPRNPKNGKHGGCNTALSKTGKPSLPSHYQHSSLMSSEKSGTPWVVAQFRIPAKLAPALFHVPTRRARQVRQGASAVKPATPATMAASSLLGSPTDNTLAAKRRHPAENSFLVAAETAAAASTSLSNPSSADHPRHPVGRVTAHGNLDSSSHPSSIPPTPPPSSSASHPFRPHPLQPLRPPRAATGPLPSISPLSPSLAEPDGGETVHPRRPCSCGEPMECTQDGGEPLHDGLALSTTVFTGRDSPTHIVRSPEADTELPIPLPPPHLSSTSPSASISALPATVASGNNAASISVPANGTLLSLYDHSVSRPGFPTTLALSAPPTCSTTPPASAVVTAATSQTQLQRSPGGNGASPDGPLHHRPAGAPGVSPTRSWGMPSRAPNRSVNNTPVAPLDRCASGSGPHGSSSGGLPEDAICAGSVSRVEMFGGRFASHTTLPLITPIDGNASSSRCTTHRTPFTFRQSPPPPPADMSSLGGNGSPSGLRRSSKGEEEDSSSIRVVAEEGSPTSNVAGPVARTPTKVAVPSYHAVAGRSPTRRTSAPNGSGAESRNTSRADRTTRPPMSNSLWSTDTDACSLPDDIRSPCGDGTLQRQSTCPFENIAHEPATQTSDNDTEEDVVVTLRLPRACCVSQLQHQLASAGILIPVVTAMSVPTPAGLSNVLATVLQSLCTGRHARRSDAPRQPRHPLDAIRRLGAFFAGQLSTIPPSLSSLPMLPPPRGPSEHGGSGGGGGGLALPQTATPTHEGGRSPAGHEHDSRQVAWCHLTSCSVGIATALVSERATEAVRLGQQLLHRFTTSGASSSACPLANHQLAYMFALARSTAFYQRWKKQQADRHQHGRQAMLRHIMQKWGSLSSRPASAATASTATTATTAAQGSLSSLATVSSLSGGHVDVLPLQVLLALTTYSEKRLTDVAARRHFAVAQALSHPYFSPYPAAHPSRPEPTHGDGTTPKPRTVPKTGKEDKRVSISESQQQQAQQPRPLSRLSFHGLLRVGNSSSSPNGEEESMSTTPLVPLMMTSFTEAVGEGAPGHPTPAPATTKGKSGAAADTAGPEAPPVASPPLLRQAHPQQRQQSVNQRPTWLGVPGAPGPGALSQPHISQSGGRSGGGEGGNTPLDHPRTGERCASLSTTASTTTVVGHLEVPSSRPHPTPSTTQAQERDSRGGERDASVGSCENEPKEPTPPLGKDTIAAAEAAFTAVSASVASLKTQLRLSPVHDVFAFGATPQDYSSRLLRLYTTRPAKQRDVVFRENVPMAMPLLPFTPQRLGSPTGDSPSLTTGFTSRNTSPGVPLLSPSRDRDREQGLLGRLSPNMFCSNGSEQSLLITPPQQAGISMEASVAAPSVSSLATNEVASSNRTLADAVCHECGCVCLSSLMGCPAAAQEPSALRAVSCEAVYCSRQCQLVAWHFHHFAECVAEGRNVTNGSNGSETLDPLVTAVRQIASDLRQAEEAILKAGTNRKGKEKHSPYTLLGVIGLRVFARILFRSVAVMCPGITALPTPPRSAQPASEEGEEQAVVNALAKMREAAVKACLGSTEEGGTEEAVAQSPFWTHHPAAEEVIRSSSLPACEQLLVAEQVLQAQGIPFFADTNLGRPLTLWEAAREVPTFLASETGTTAAGQKRRGRSLWVGPLPPEVPPIFPAHAAADKRSLLLTATAVVMDALQTLSRAVQASCARDDCEGSPRSTTATRLLVAFGCPRFADQVWDFAVTSFCVLDRRGKARNRKTASMSKTNGLRLGQEQQQQQQPKEGSHSDEEDDFFDEDDPFDAAALSIATTGMSVTSQPGKTGASSVSSALTDSAGVTLQTAAAQLSSSHTGAPHFRSLPAVPMIVLSPFLSLTVDLQQYSPENFYSTRFFPEHAERGKAVVAAAATASAHRNSPRLAAGSLRSTGFVGGGGGGGGASSIGADQSISFLSINSASASAASAATFLPDGGRSLAEESLGLAGSSSPPPSCYFGQERSAFTDALDMNGRNIDVRLMKQGNDTSRCTEEGFLCSPFIVVARAAANLGSGETLYTSVPVVTDL